MARISTQPKAQDNTLCNISNELIECFVKKGNLVAFKILFFIATKRIETQGAYAIFDIDIKNLCTFCQIDIKTLRRNIKQMVDTTISITDEHSESYTSVISYAKFAYNENKLRVEIRENILKLINETRNRFTIIDASKVMKLSSKHSIRMLMLLEYIAGFSDTANRKQYSLQELNLMFGTNYPRLLEFERKILTPIKQELDETSRLSFAYQLKYDKETATVGRARAVGVVIDTIQNKKVQPSLF